MSNIIVTGASKGIGFETVLELTQYPGHSVLAISRSREGLERLYKIARQLNPEARLDFLVMNLVKDSFEGLLSPFLHDFFTGPIDILINNAATLIRKPFLDTSDEEFRGLMDSNFLSPIRLIQYLYPRFNQAGTHILNIGSMGGVQGSVKFSGLSAYSASKAALHTITECLAEEFKETKIRVNALALGSVQTEMVEEAFPGYEAPVMAFEMGAYIAHFALTGHTFFNGKILPVAVSTP